jgi:Zn finger protein HypA/HybF involved in hydrogenase expression
MTLESAAAAHLRLMVWCKACRHQMNLDPAEQARWYGPETPVPEWRRRLVCSQCGSRNVDMVVTGTKR